MAHSTWLTGHALDQGALGPRQLASILGGLPFLPGLVWWALQARGRHWYQTWDVDEAREAAGPPV